MDPASTPEVLNDRRVLVRDALDALGIRNLLLGIHDAAFPSREEEDVGRGTPYSAGAADFLDFVASLGFGGVQLGPQGLTSESNPSPYDGTLFSKNPLSVALLPLTTDEWGAILARETLGQGAAGRPGPPERVPYEYVFSIQYRALAEAHGAFWRRSAAGDPALGWLVEGFGAFRRANADWLERDAFYELLQDGNGGRHWTAWLSAEGEPLLDQRLWDPPRNEEGAAVSRRAQLREAHAVELEAFAFTQYLLHEQHRRLREQLGRLSLKLFGDLQIGLSTRDSWFARGFLLPDYVMGAPPSRTNPEGQAWDYGVLDPERYDAPWIDGVRREGPALRFLRARVGKMFDDFDGIRIDHPHGFVCPWVYRARAGPAPGRPAGRAAVLLARSPRPPRSRSLRHRPTGPARPLPPPSRRRLGARPLRGAGGPVRRSLRGDRRRRLPPGPQHP